MAVLNLTTRADYKAYMGINSTNSDASIDILIPLVSQFVKNYCRRTFVDHFEDPKVEILRGGVPYLMLLETPIISITSIEVSSDYGVTYTALTEYTDWVLDGELIRPIGVSSFPDYIRGYRVTYTAGYEDVPRDLELAVMDLVTYYMKNDGAVNALKHVNTTSMQIEYISDTALPSHIKRVIDYYITDYA